MISMVASLIEIRLNGSTCRRSRPTSRKMEFTISFTTGFSRIPPRWHILKLEGL